MKDKAFRKAARIVLGGVLAFAGTSPLTFAREDFRAQVPDGVPFSKDTTVLASGLAEIGLGGALAFAGEKSEETVGKVAAAFFTAIFPGNIAQYVHRRDAFGLDTDRKRLARLFFQPALVYWTLKSTGNLEERHGGGSERGGCSEGKLSRPKGEGIRLANPETASLLSGSVASAGLGQPERDAGRDARGTYLPSKACAPNPGKST